MIVELKWNHSQQGAIELIKKKSMIVHWRNIQENCLWSELIMIKNRKHGCMIEMCEK